VSALEQVVGAVHESLAPYRRETPASGHFELSGHRAFTVEAVYEGFLMHYREPRSFSLDMDPDLRLLAGDSLYAIGLERLAEHGDLAAVAELADLISASAQAEAEGRPEDAEARWEASARALAE
jgi:hypothetical protein